MAIRPAVTWPLNASFHGDIAELAQVSISMYGTARNYLALGDTNVQIDANPDFTVAMLYE